MTSVSKEMKAASKVAFLSKSGGFNNNVQKEARKMLAV